MIILFGGEKGGTGKTTLATNIAALRALSGGDILVMDTDKQGSAGAWSATRDANENPCRVPTIQKFGNGIAAEVRDLKNRFSDIVIDAGGRDSVELRAAMTVADKIFIPIQASQFDVWTLGQMETLVTQAQGFNPNLSAVIIINRASTNPTVNESAEVMELMQDFALLTIAPFVVRERIAFRKAAKSGLAVTELQPEDLKASQEIQQLYHYIFNEGVNNGK
jgi:chromosome partitioning protein